MKAKHKKKNAVKSHFQYDYNVFLNLALNVRIHIVKTAGTLPLLMAGACQTLSTKDLTATFSCQLTSSGAQQNDAKQLLAKSI